MTAVVEMVGRRCGRLTVMARAASQRRQAMWACACDCGALVTARGTDLRNGNTTSCGCRVLEILARSVHGGARRHQRRTEHVIWCSMLQRCENPKSRAYARYGGRGIAVCARWRASFSAFLADMGARPPGMSIDRRNNDGPYDAGNCRWATSREQNGNRRDNVRVQFGGETVCRAEAARRLGIRSSALGRRLAKGLGITALEAENCALRALLGEGE